MADLILKAHGGIANGTISEEEDGRYRASLLVRDLTKEIQQMRGPEFFRSKDRAKAWIEQQARYHGFTGGDFDIQIEEGSS